MVSCVIDLGNFDILCLCNLSDEPGRLPAWAVDWSELSANNVTQIKNPCAIGESSCEVNFVGTEILEAEGAQCTAFTSVGPCFEAGISDADLVQTLSKLM